jgi:hypothetical protein
MIPQQFFYQLVALGLLWLFVMLHYIWPSRCAPTPQTPQRPAKPITPPRKRSNEPKSFAGLTQKPHCALCEQVATHPASPPPVPSEEAREIKVRRDEAGLPELCILARRPRQNVRSMTLDGRHITSHHAMELSLRRRTTPPLPAAGFAAPWPSTEGDFLPPKTWPTRHHQSSADGPGPWLRRDTLGYSVWRLSMQFPIAQWRRTPLHLSPCPIGLEDIHPERCDCLVSVSASVTAPVSCQGP